MSLPDGVAASTRRLAGAEPASLDAAAITLRPAQAGPSRRKKAEELACVVRALRASRARIVAAQEAVPVEPSITEAEG